MRIELLFLAFVFAIVFAFFCADKFNSSNYECLNNGVCYKIIVSADGYQDAVEVKQ